MSRAMPKGRAHMTAAANVRGANVECEDANVEGEESQPKRWSVKPKIVESESNRAENVEGSVGGL